MSLEPIQNINKVIINAADLGADQTSETVEVRESVGFAAQIYWSGGTATAGDVIVEGTNDDQASDSTPTYTQISSDSVSTTSGSLMKNNSGVYYSYVRVRWDQSAGTGGTITCIISAKRR